MSKSKDIQDYKIVEGDTVTDLERRVAAELRWWIPQGGVLVVPTTEYYRGFKYYQAMVTYVKY